MVGMLGVGQSRHLGRATAVDSVVCLMSCLEEKSFLALVIAAWHRMQPSLFASLKQPSPFP
jgi:hypothetical protein